MVLLLRQHCLVFSLVSIIAHRVGRGDPPDDGACGPAVLEPVDVGTVKDDKKRLRLSKMPRIWIRMICQGETVYKSTARATGAARRPVSSDVDGSEHQI